MLKNFNFILGSLKWYFLTGGSIDSSPAIGFDGTVFVGATDGTLYSIDSRGIIDES